VLLTITKSGEIVETSIHTLDLKFMGIPRTIACYLIPHENGAVLVESGPGSTLPALRDALKAHGLAPADITDVLLTHIHLDHAGAAGWLSRQGARIHVHPVGAPHMLNPEKLLASARRIYGDMMETLWGEFLPVPEERLSVLHDGELLEIEGLRFRAIDTPGHAEHHFAYLFEDVCFSGDIGGVRLPGTKHIRLPMPPPEFRLEKWRKSLARLQEEQFTRIAPTHFGLFSDPDWHLGALEQALDEVDEWMEIIMPEEPEIERLKEDVTEWARERSLEDGVDPKIIEAYETANPSWMSAYGIQRYWRKFRNPDVAPA
jgi:glyoxylase-like metal-dependent hydrolase (beta-lactamase superfamily II)